MLNDIDIRTPEQISLKFQLAGLGSRSTALMIDAIIILLIETALGVGGAYFTHLTSAASNYLDALMIFIGFVLWWVYFSLTEFFFAGQTPGKRLAGIRVIQENGQNLTLLSAFIRNLLRIIDFLPALFFLGMFMIFFHPMHKRLGDLASGTIVIHERRRGKKRNLSSLDKAIAKKGIRPDRITIDEWSRKKITSKEWQLLKTYLNRPDSLSNAKQDPMTRDVAKILLPILNLPYEKKTEDQLESDLMAVYIQLRDDWEYEL